MPLLDPNLKRVLTFKFVSSVLVALCVAIVLMAYAESRYVMPDWFHVRVISSLGAAILTGVVVYLISDFFMKPDTDAQLTTVLMQAFEDHKPDNDAQLKAALMRAFADHKPDTDAQLKAALLQACADHFPKINMLLNAGIKEVDERFPEAAFLDALNRLNAGDEVRILQGWLTNASSLSPHLWEAAERGCKIRLLLMNPASAVALERARQLNVTDLKALSSLEEISRLRLKRSSAATNNFKVRRYQVLPGVTMHTAGAVCCYVGFFLNENANNTIHIAVEHKSSLMNTTMNTYFEDIWGDQSTEEVPI
jgi:hypothetical protein